MVNEGEDLSIKGLSESFYTSIFDHTTEINIASADVNNSSNENS